MLAHLKIAPITTPHIAMLSMFTLHLLHQHHQQHHRHPHQGRCPLSLPHHKLVVGASKCTGNWTTRRSIIAAHKSQVIIIATRPRRAFGCGWLSGRYTFTGFTNFWGLVLHRMENFQFSNRPALQPSNFTAFQPLNLRTFQYFDLLTFQLFSKSVCEQEKRENPLNTESV